MKHDLFTMFLFGYCTASLYSFRGIKNRLVHCTLLVSASTLGHFVGARAFVGRASLGCAPLTIDGSFLLGPSGSAALSLIGGMLVGGFFCRLIYWTPGSR
jgi:hypothetical protein